MRKILACVDGSDISGSVVRQAFSLAAANGAEALEILHVVDSKVESPLLTAESRYGIHPMADIRKAVQEKVEEYMSGIAKRDRVSCEVDVVVGNPYRTIVKRAGEEGVDLVVMGHRGQKGLNRFLLGSVAAKTVAYAPCHVLVLRSHGSEKPNKVLVAVDGGETSADVAAFGLDHALKVGAEEVLFLNVIEDLTEVSHTYWGAYTADPEYYARISRKARETLAGILDGITPTRNTGGVILKTEIEQGPIHATVIRVAESEGADLVVVGDRGKAGFEGFLLGSVSAKIVRYAHCGVLVYRTAHGAR